jgi:uncharacterized membrane protein YfcA
MRGLARWNGRARLCSPPPAWLGAFLGASLGKQLDGTELLALFGLAMVAVGIYMLAFRHEPPANDVRLTTETAAHLLPPLLGFGLGVGVLSGFTVLAGDSLSCPASCSPPA